jgi:transposase
VDTTAQENGRRNVTTCQIRKGNELGAHTPAFKADTVAFVRSGRSAEQVAYELGLANSLVYDCCRQAEVDAGKGPPGALTTAEKEELSQEIPSRPCTDGEFPCLLLGLYLRVLLCEGHANCVARSPRPAGSESSRSVVLSGQLARRF